LASGSVVAAVWGKLNANGVLKPDRLILSEVQYVPGATKVLVSGRITAVDTATARFALGRLVVDYSRLLSTGEINFAVGDLVGIKGIQAGTDSVLIADDLKHF